MDLNSGRLVAVNVVTNPMTPDILGDQQHVFRFFDELIARIKMVPLRAPEAVVVPPNPHAVGDAVADDGGLTVQCIISTSHIAYHSWPLQNRFRLVVDSCKDFDPDEVVRSIKCRFPVKSMVVQDVPYENPSEVPDGAVLLLIDQKAGVHVPTQQIEAQA